MGKEKLQVINQGNNVPDKTISLFFNNKEVEDKFKDNDRLSGIICKPEKTREWFDPNFYRCLPLAIGNQHGFIIKSEFDIAFIWDGGPSAESTRLFFTEEKEELSKKFPRIESHFGHGVITINPPFTLRTPPGVNLMTINPPNHVITNITVMTGVVEADNLRRNFTFNLKVQTPNIQTFIPAGTPLAAFIPIPRYYSDSFELEYAKNIFDKNVIDEELKAAAEADNHRINIEPTLPNGVGRHYFKGKDVYGNKFPDHQKP